MDTGYSLNWAWLKSKSSALRRMTEKNKSNKRSFAALRTTAFFETPDLGRGRSRANPKAWNA